jgi:hypothetical protein
MVIITVLIPLLIQADSSELSHDYKIQWIAIDEHAAGLITSTTPLLKRVFDKLLASFLNHATDP